MATKKAKFDYLQYLDNRAKCLSRLQLFEITVEDMKNAYDAGHRDFTHSKIDGGTIDFNLEAVEMYHVRFNNVTFKEMSIINSKVYNGIFDKCSFSEVGFVNTDTGNSAFTYCSIKSLNVSNQSSVVNCFFRNSDVYYCLIDQCNLSGTEFFTCEFIGAKIRKCDCQEMKLNKCALSDSDFHDCDLSRAQIINCSCMGFDLLNCNLNGTRGIYSMFALYMSSRKDILQAGVIVNRGKIKLRFWTGCQKEISAKDLIKEINYTHGDSLRGKNYLSIVETIKEMFENEMAEHVWDYLIDLNPESTKE